MYIRFVSPHRDRVARVETGIFGAAYEVDYTPWRFADQPWHVAALRRELDWFARALKAPDRLHLRPGRKGFRSGFCWFRPEAQDHIAHARHMAWVLGELGRPIAEIRSRKPGTILWQDRYQIVALPSGDVPRGFH